MPLAELARVLHVEAAQRRRTAAAPRSLGARETRHLQEAARDGCDSPCNTLQKRPAAGPRGWHSLRHSAKAGRGGATGAVFLETLCKSGPRPGRGGGNP